MARIRSIKPDFWTDGDVVSLSYPARLLFIGSWNFAICDNGHVADDARRLKMQVLPADDVDPVALIDELIASGRMVRLLGSDGRTYLHIKRFTDHQKIEKRWTPRCPACLDEGLETAPVSTNRHTGPRANSTNLPETPATSAPEGKGGEGKGREGKGVSAARASDAPPEASHLCNLLADLIEANGSKRPEITKKWLDEARLMLQRDGRKADHAETLIRWCQADTFWRTNVLSMPKFRQKYDQLRLQALSEWERGRSAVSPDGAIDVDAVLGAEKFVPPPPPDDLNPGTTAWQTWHREQRDQWKADRERRAREIVARRSA